MWARVENNKIVEYYSNKKSLVLNNVRYSSQIFTIWTDEERAGLGIYSVENPVYPNTKFHSTSEITYTFNEEQKKVIGTHTVSDRNLDDTNAIDKNSDPILDDHNNQQIVLGLKSKEINAVKLEAANLIKSYDWLTQRKVTADTDIPEIVLIYIANVRSKCEEICTALTNANDIIEFKQLFENRKRDDFPDDYYVRGYRR
jgi:hypothetical protein